MLGWNIDGRELRERDLQFWRSDPVFIGDRGIGGFYTHTHRLRSLYKKAAAAAVSIHSRCFSARVLIHSFPSRTAAHRLTGLPSICGASFSPIIGTEGDREREREPTTMEAPLYSSCRVESSGRVNDFHQPAADVSVRRLSVFSAASD